MLARDIIEEDFFDQYTYYVFNDRREVYYSVPTYKYLPEFCTNTESTHWNIEDDVVTSGRIGEILLQLLQPEFQKEISHAEQIIQTFFENLRKLKRLPYEVFPKTYAAVTKISPVFSIVLNSCIEYHWQRGENDEDNIFEELMIPIAIQQPITLAADYIRQGLAEPLFFTYDFLLCMIEAGILKKGEIGSVSSPEKNSSTGPTDMRTIIISYKGEFNGEAAKAYYFNQEGCAEGYRQYKTPTLEHFITASLLGIFRNGYVIKKCENCGRYFIPYQKANALYCDQPSPQDASKTCKEYAQQRLWYDRIKQDETAKLFRNIYQAKQIRMKRNPGNTILQEDFEHFKAEGKQWKAAVKEGAKTEAEFLAWLQAVKQKKVKKDGNPR